MSSAEDTPFTIERYPDREAWLEARRAGIGASDAPGVLGVSPWSSPFTVYCEKLGIDRRPEDAAHRTERLKWGSLLQDPIAKELGTRLKVAIDIYPPTTIWRHKMEPWLQASLDGETTIEDRRGAVEIKTASIFERKTWTHEGEVPLPYQVQAQHQMLVTGYQFVLVGVLIGTEELRHTIIDRDPDFISLMLQRELEFWNQVQQRQQPSPDGSNDAKKLLGKLSTYAPQQVIDLADPEDIDLDARWKAAQAETKRWEEELDLVKNLVQARMGGAALAKLANGATWTQILRKRRAYTANVAATEWRELKRS